MTTMTRRETNHSDEFGALCNLFHAIICDKQELTPAEMGDILYYRGYPVVCDESRDAARAVMAFLGLRFTGSQPVHEPGRGCKFSDGQGNCDFHDVRHANALVDEMENRTSTDLSSGEAAQRW